MSVYAVSDLHGMYDLYAKIKDFLKPDDIVYCLGDCGDRGPDGWRIIKEIYNDPQWIYLKGNHEDMLAKAIKFYYNYDYSEAYELLCYNGGSKTYEDWGKDTQWDKQWANKLAELPVTATYDSASGLTILLSHSGYNPIPEEERSKPYTDHDFIWNRNHMSTGKWLGKDNEVIVHGHTPVRYSHKARNHQQMLEIDQYCEGHKIDIDCASWYTGVSCLLDLDTLKATYFYTAPLKN